jgi:hypothetical protein
MQRNSSRSRRAGRDQIRHLLLAVVLIDRSDDVHTSAEASGPRAAPKAKTLARNNKNRIGRSGRNTCWGF